MESFRQIASRRTEDNLKRVPESYRRLNALRWRLSRTRMVLLQWAYCRVPNARQATAEVTPGWHPECAPGAGQVEVSDLTG